MEGCSFWILLTVYFHYCGLLLCVCHNTIMLLRFKNMSVSRTFSTESYSERDATRREFVNSARVMTTTSPTPLSETPRDFQLICGNSNLIGSMGLSPVVINGCHCGPECREACCVSKRGWAMTPSSLGGNQQRPNIDHGRNPDTVSIESSDSHLGDSGETPLLSPTGQPFAVSPHMTKGICVSKYMCIQGHTCNYSLCSS